MELPRSFEGASALPADAVPTAVRAAALASRGSGEPVGGYLYDLSAAQERATRLVTALPAAAKVCYAVKANSFSPLLGALAEVVHGFEVASVAEARLALAAAAKAEVRPRLVVSGPAKNSTMLAGLVGPDAPDGAVVVNVESVLELHRLSRAAVAAGRHAPGREVPVALRVNPQRSPVEVARATGLTMGGVPSPFGIPEAEIPDALRALGSLPGVRFIGFHLHAVSGNMDADLHADYVRGAVEWAVRTADEHGLRLRAVDVGGGLGIPFEPGPEFDVETFGAALAALPLPEDVELILEPGRWMAGPVGWYATEVVDVKRSYGEVFVVVRGGINHFQLPISWEIRHNFAVLPVDDWPVGLPRPGVERAAVTVSGELCTPEDVLARGVTVDSVRAGDLLIFPNAGAYGFEFAMPAFLGQPPAWRTALTRPDGHAPRPRPASRVDDLADFR
ncbi:alanine racemase [Cryptosporangium aurantiacum]|uniref:Diaminopimelate decarboxylase n=1 Tax=Cryptosporangium aurantiacum TaxID=134849 RepID=A0A1M7N5W6_9ACTN|nr:alanine racemase [Cryptosporangium aurantiacum]SHM98979.1 diaminopimelate decarboxylase [Cryptosporangium aurantiacum]